MTTDAELVVAIEDLAKVVTGINDTLRRVTELTIDIDNRLISLIGVLGRAEGTDPKVREELAAIAEGFREKRAELARIQELDRLRRGR